MSEVKWSDTIDRAKARYVSLYPMPIMRSRVLGSTEKVVLAELYHDTRIYRPDHPKSLVHGKLRRRTIVKRVGLSSSNVGTALSRLRDVLLLVRYEHDGVFQLHRARELTLGHLFLLWPARVDDRETAMALQRLIRSTHGLEEYEERFFDPAGRPPKKAELFGEQALVKRWARLVGLLKAQPNSGPARTRIRALQNLNSKPGGRI